MKKKNNSGVLYFLLAVSLLSITLMIVFVGCSKTKNDQTVVIDNYVRELNVKKIRFVGQWMNEGKRGSLIRDFCREYEFKNQEILIDLKFPEEFMANHTDRQSNVALVGDLVMKNSFEWDIIRLNNQMDNIATYIGDPLWAKKHLVDFSQYPEFNRNTMPKLLTEQVKQQWGGIIPGPFLEGSYWALWTNKNVTDKLGIEIKSKGMTIDDFITYLKLVNEYNLDNPTDYITPIHEAGDWKTAFAFVFHLYASALNNTQELFSLEVTENKLNAWYKTLIALETISELNPFDNNWRNLKWSESNKDPLNENCLFYINGSWMYNIWEDANAKNTLNIFPAELPVFNSINLYPSAYFITWGVLKNSPNRDEAVKILMAMNTPEVADMWVRNTKCPTGIVGHMGELAFGTDQFEGFTNYVQNQYGDNIYNYSEDLALYIAGNKLADMTYYREVLTGELTAAKAIELVKGGLGKN